MGVKVSEESSVVKVPQATCIISHRVDRPRNVVKAHDVTVGSLMVGVQTQEIGTGGGSSGGAFGSPRDRGAVVAGYPQRAFLDGAMLCKDVFVCNCGGELQIGDGHSAVRAICSDECCADLRRKPLTPNNRRCGGNQGVEPDASHALSTSVAGADVRGGNWNQLSKSRGTGAQRGRHPFKIVDAGEDMLVEAQAMTIPPAQCILKN
jgi:hypothetical protein